MKQPDIFSTLQLVHELYKDKTDKQGTPYINHLLNVMFACPNDEEIRMAALLHDVVEDELLTFEELEEIGYSDYVVMIVNYLTRSISETYFDYIVNIRNSNGATAIKVADLQDNLAKCNTPQFDSLKQRYEKALRMLQDEVH